MSFRNRLTLFFIVIVIVPMIAVALVLFRLVSDSEQGKADARLGQAQTSALGLFRDAQRRAAEAGAVIARDRELAAAIEAGDRIEVQGRLVELSVRARARRTVMRLDGLGRFESGRAQVVAPATSSLLDRDERTVGTLRAAVATAEEYAAQVKSVTGLETVVRGSEGTLASTLAGFSAEGLPLRGESSFAGEEYRHAGFRAGGFDGRPTTILLFADEDDTASAVTSSSLIVAGLLVAFLLLAFAFAMTVSRSLQAQIQSLLDAARRLGKGEFSISVPTEGNDEFAALGSEFNSMARELEARLEDLQNERARLQEAIRRVGESFAKGLDRDALLEIVVQTAIDGVGADCGRATVRDEPEGPLIERARAGDLASFRQAIQAVEAAVLDAREPAETVVADGYALGQPLKASEGADRVLGLISVARNSRPYSAAEKELFHYLANQAAVSIENVDLHETVQRQAVTDELTGLFNHRRFQEVVTTEVERSRRFGSSLGLIMLDIDNFKKVNDTYGHLQGDLVLREVARVLLETSREIDEPARYGGEEMVVALPETDLEGAFQFAERVRQRIEGLELPILDGNHGGAKLRVTASFGAAALPHSSDADVDALVAAADAALYRAKRAGKNRVVRAE